MRASSSKPEIVVNQRAVEELVAKQLINQPGGRRKIAVYAVAMAVMPVVIPFLVNASFGNWDLHIAYLRAEPMSAVGVPAAIGLLLAAFLVVVSLHPSSRSVPRITRRVEQTWRYLNERGWVARVGAWGVLAGAAIGIPLGMLMASDLRGSELNEAVGWLGAVLMFLGMTLLWTVPSAYIYRWFILRQYRPLLSVSSDGDSFDD